MLILLKNVWLLIEPPEDSCPDMPDDVMTLGTLGVL